MSGPSLCCLPSWFYQNSLLLLTSCVQEWIFWRADNINCCYDQCSIVFTRTNAVHTGHFCEPTAIKEAVRFYGSCLTTPTQIYYYFVYRHNQPAHCAAWVSLAIRLLSSVVTVAMPGCSCDQAFWRKFVRNEFRLAKFLPLHRDYRLFVFTPVSDVARQLHTCLPALCCHRYAIYGTVQQP